MTDIKEPLLKWYESGSENYHEFIMIFDETIKQAFEEALLKGIKKIEARQQWVSNGTGLSFRSFDSASVEAGFCADELRKLIEEYK